MNEQKTVLRDPDIREPLFEFLEEKYGKIRIIEEKNIGRSRADVMLVLPAGVVGLEIKSDADTYARLESQIKDYDRYFDENIVAVGSSHALHVQEHVPEHWGIISVEALADGTLDFYVLREPKENPWASVKEKIQLLWRPELAHIQELNGMHEYKQKSKDFVRNKIVETVPLETLQRQISEELFERDYSEIQETIDRFRMQEGKRRKRRRRRRKRAN